MISPIWYRLKLGVAEQNHIPPGERRLSLIERMVTLLLLQTHMIGNVGMGSRLGLKPRKASQHDDAKALLSQLPLGSKVSYSHI